MFTGDVWFDVIAKDSRWADHVTDEECR